MLEEQSEQLTDVLVLCLCALLCTNCFLNAFSIHWRAIKSFHWLLLGAQSLNVLADEPTFSGRLSSPTEGGLCFIWLDYVAFGPFQNCNWMEMWGRGGRVLLVNMIEIKQLGIVFQWCVYLLYLQLCLLMKCLHREGPLSFCCTGFTRGNQGRQLKDPVWS